MGVFQEFCDYNNKDNGEDINLSTCEENFDYLCPFSESQDNKNESNFNNRSKAFDEKDNTNQNLKNKIMKSNTLNKKQTDLTTNITYNINTSYEMNFNYYNKLDSNINNNIQNSKLKFISNKNPSKLKKLKLKNKTIFYIGGKIEGKKEGFGKQIWAKDSYYIWNYKNDKANGLGIFFSNNNIYKGEFKSDVANGYGIYNYNNEIIYEGYWDKDLQNR